MVLRLIQVGKFIDVLKMIFSINGIFKLKNDTTKFVGNWIGRVAHYRRKSIMRKRLQKACHQQLRDTCKAIKRGPCKCDCNKCAEIRSMQKQRVMAIDSLDNLAYQYRVSHPRPLKDFVANETNSEFDDTELMESSRQDHRDLQPSKSNQVAWWTDMNHRVFMPPLLQEHDVKPTRSGCSITSDIHYGTDDIPNLNAISRSSTPNSEDSDYKSCKDISTILPINADSKSNEKIPLSMKIELKSVAKSVSIPLGQRPKKLRGSKIVAKRKLRMKRPVRRTTRHTTDCFSNHLKCSKISLKPCKKS